jgi:hypothetical protein
MFDFFTPHLPPSSRFPYNQALPFVLDLFPSSKAVTSYLDDPECQKKYSTQQSKINFSFITV